MIFLHLKDMEFIKISSNKKPISKGVYGRYFKISSRIGIKILGKGYKKFSSVFKKYILNNAHLESMLLKKAELSGISPKFAKAIIVSYQGLFYPGIKMEHINGKTLFEIDPYFDIKKNYVNKNGKLLKEHSKNSTKVSLYLNNKLKKFGIKNRDIHLNNIIISKSGKIKIIDFSPEWISLSE